MWLPHTDMRPHIAAIFPTHSYFFFCSVPIISTGFRGFCVCVNSMTFSDSGHILASTRSRIVFLASTNLLALDTTAIFGFGNSRIGRTNRRSITTMNWDFVPSFLHASHEFGILFKEKEKREKKSNSNGERNWNLPVWFRYFFATGRNRCMMMPFAVKTDQGFDFLEFWWRFNV